jgi:hypothetical protein
MRVPVLVVQVSWLVAAAACRFAPGTAEQAGDSGIVGPVDGGSGSSAPHDAGTGSGSGSGSGSMIDAPPSCYGGGPAMTCLDSPPTTAYPGGSLDVDTDPTSPQCRGDVTTPKGNIVCVIAYTAISLDGTISAHGSRPLVIVSAGNITIEQGGSVDVGSHGSGTPQALGPAANGTCNTGTPGSHGGGPGGSFGGIGGGGGTPNTLPSTAGALVLATTLRGGCMGADGDSSPGSHGDGGGAVAVVTNATLEIDGYIDASGGFGNGGDGPSYGGGGGGGAGGMIEIAASAVTGGGQVFAAGGGGGEGGEDDSTATAGKSGGDPSATTLDAGAIGGSGNTLNAGDGGSGDGLSDAISIDGVDGQSGTGGSLRAGGGGGGGSSGYLLIHVANATGFTGTTLPGALPN